MAKDAPWEQYSSKQETPSAPAAGGNPWEQYGGTATPAPAPAKKEGFWSKVLSGTAKALNTRPEQISGYGLLDPNFKVREKTPEEEKKGPTTAAKRAANTMGIVQGAVGDPLMAGAQLLGANKQVQDYNKGYEDFRKQLVGDGFDASRLIGNVVSPVAVKGAGAIDKGFKAWGKTPGLFQKGATHGAFAGITQPVLNDPNAPINPDTGLPEEKDLLTEKAVQAGTGALLGGGLNKLIGRGSPQAFTNPSQLPATPGQLANQKPAPALSQVEQYRQMFPDADLTWGQSLGGKFNDLEQKMTSLPFVGNTIARAREKSLQNQNVSMMNKALEPAGIKLDKGASAGRGMFDEAYGKLSGEYDKVLDKAALHNPDQLRAKIYGTLDNGNYHPGAVGDDYGKLSEKGKETFDRLMEEGLFKRFGKDPSGTHSVRMTGRQFKNHEESFKNTINDYMSGSGEDRAIGRMLKNALGEAYQSLEGATPEVSKQLKNLNKSYAQFKTLETASTASAGSGGVFNPLQTIKAATKGNRAQVARGKGLLQEEAELSQDVLGRTVPDSGTAGRLMGANPFTALAGGALDTVLYPFLSPKAATIATQGGKKLGRKIENTKIGKALADQADKITPSAVRTATSSSPSEKEEEEHRRGGLVSMRDAYWGSGYNSFNEDELEEAIRDFHHGHRYADGGLTQNADGSITIPESYAVGNLPGPQKLGAWSKSPQRKAQQNLMVAQFERRKAQMDPGLRGLIEKYMQEEPNPELAMARASEEFVTSRPNTYFPQAQRAIGRALDEDRINMVPESFKRSFADGGEVVWSDIQGAEQPVQDPREIAYGQPLEDTSFVGAASKIFRPKLAKYAEKMEKAGKTPEQIWNKTMTARIPETGQWAQEIDDTAFKMHGTFDKNWRHLDKGFKADQLFEAYPELKTQFYRNNPDMRGFASHSYTPVPGARELEKHMFDLNLPKMADKGKDPHSSMLHEIQHYIQAREGWPQGGSQETGAALAIKAGKGQPLLPPETEKILQGNIQEFQGLRDQVAGMPRFKGKTEHLRKLDKEINDRLGLIEDKKGKMGATPEVAYDFYKRLGGEAQSRLTERRMGLTAKERKQYYPFMERNEANPYGMDVNPKDLINKGYGEHYAGGGWLDEPAGMQGPDLTKSFVNEAQAAPARDNFDFNLIPKNILKAAVKEEEPETKKASKKIASLSSSSENPRLALMSKEQRMPRGDGGGFREEIVSPFVKGSKAPDTYSWNTNDVSALQRVMEPYSNAYRPDNNPQSPAANLPSGIYGYYTPSPPGGFFNDVPDTLARLSNNSGSVNINARELGAAGSSPNAQQFANLNNLTMRGFATPARPDIRSFIDSNGRINFENFMQAEQNYDNQIRSGTAYQDPNNYTRVLNRLTPEEAALASGQSLQDPNGINYSNTNTPERVFNLVNKIEGETTPDKPEVRKKVGLPKPKNSKLGWEADIPLYQDDRNEFRFSGRGNTGKKDASGMFTFTRKFADGGEVEPSLLDTAQYIGQGLTNKEAWRQTKEGAKRAIKSIPSVAESLGRGAIATIPGTPGDVSDLARLLAPETMQKTFGERSLPTTEELLHQMPRLSKPTEGAEDFEMMGGILGGVLPIAKAGKLAKLAKATPRKRGGLAQVKKPL